MKKLVIALIGLSIGATAFGQGLIIPKQQYVFCSEDGACYCFTNALLPVGMPNVFVWGNSGPVSNGVPVDLTNAVQVSISTNHCVALCEDGSMRAWGTNNFGQTDVPVLGLPATQVVAGKNWSAAVLSDGTVKWWGKAPTNSLPFGGLQNVYEVETAGTNLIVLDVYGNVSTYNTTVSTPTINNAIAISCTTNRYAAVLNDGTICLWGGGSTNVCSSMATNGWKIAMNQGVTMLARNDGTAVWWQTTGTGQGTVVSPGIMEIGCNVPSGSFFWIVQSNTLSWAGSGNPSLPFLYPVDYIDGKFGIEAVVYHHQ